MKATAEALAEFLLSFAAFRDALQSLGWNPPGVDPKGGGGHSEE